MAASNNMNPQQLKLFMTPREITSQYQPLDADRHDNDNDWGNGTGDSTNRSHNTAGVTNPYNSRNFGSGSGEHTHYARASTPAGTESDDELWDRKADEAEYDRTVSSKHGEVSLAQSIRDEGVKSPIHLSTNQFGMQGKPEIVGGHHRLAIASEEPDRLVPVLHHNDIWSAQSKQKNPHGYT